MGSYFFSHISLEAVQLWHIRLCRELAQTDQIIDYDSGNVRLLVVTPLEGLPIALVLAGLPERGPVLDEQVALELSARAKLEDTRVPRRRAYLRYLWCHPARVDGCTTLPSLTL